MIFIEYCVEEILASFQSKKMKDNKRVKVLLNIIQKIYDKKAYFLKRYSFYFAFSLLLSLS